MKFVSLSSLSAFSLSCLHLPPSLSLSFSCVLSVGLMSGGGQPPTLLTRAEAQRLVPLYFSQLTQGTKARKHPSALHRVALYPLTFCRDYLGCGRRPCLNSACAGSRDYSIVCRGQDERRRKENVVETATPLITRSLCLHYTHAHTHYTHAHTHSLSL